MPGHQKWESVRDRYLQTPEGRERYRKARIRLDRKIVWYNRRQRAREVIACFFLRHRGVNKFSGEIICGRCSKFLGRWSS